MMDYEEIIDRFETLENPEETKGMSTVGIVGTKVYGIRIPVLRTLAKEAGKRNHELAQKLWKHGSREARILAAMVDDPKKVDEDQFERWIKDFDSWEVCDQAIMCLFEKTPLAWEKAFEWIDRKSEFEKRAGFVMMARLAVSDKKTEDDRFTAFFPLIKREAHDERNFVKKAINWALRQIGKRSMMLHEQALRTAYEILEIDAKSAQWIARDAIKELESEAVRKRLIGKKS